MQRVAESTLTIQFTLLDSVMEILHMHSFFSVTMNGIQSSSSPPTLIKFQLTLVLTPYLTNNPKPHVQINPSSYLTVHRVECRFLAGGDPLLFFLSPLGEGGVAAGARSSPPTCVGAKDSV